jgi:Fe2+ or Zn2+ uptake regulation protein
MARTPFYLIALEHMPEPATVKEICDKAREMFGPQIRASRHTVRASLERFAQTDRVHKFPDGNGKFKYALSQYENSSRVFKYALSQYENSSRVYLEKRITELETDLIRLRAALADLKSACNAQAACYDSLT